MKKRIFAFVLAAAASLILFAGHLSAKPNDGCAMCSAQGKAPVVCAKCDWVKARKSSVKGTDLKCCCESCAASDQGTAECREQCGMPAQGQK